MGAGNHVINDPERTVATAVRDGGDAAYSGTHPSTPQQSVADMGQMTPPEPDIDVETVARIYHLTSDDDDEYKVTRIEIEAVATVKVNGEQLRISDYGAMEERIWDLSVNDVKKLVDDVESTVADKAFKFMVKRREILDILREARVEIALEKVVSEEYFEDDYEDDP